jgi:hypothetical protein
MLKAVVYDGEKIKKIKKYFKFWNIECTFNIGPQNINSFLKEKE